MPGKQSSVIQERIFKSLVGAGSVIEFQGSFGVELISADIDSASK
jgi:hypothetical protein